MLLGKTVTELINNNDQIYRDDERGLVLIKMRVPNSGRKEGKSGGFRVYVLLDTTSKETSLLEVYPKTGRYEKSALSESEEEYVLSVFISEKNKGVIKVHDLKTSTDLSREFSFEGDSDDDVDIEM